MAQDHTQSATAITTTASLRPTLKDYLSSWNVRETAGSTALVKIRDSLALPAKITSAADGAAGNSTAGLHMYLITWVTAHGQSTYGRNAADRLEHTTAGSKIVNLTGIPLSPTNSDGRHATIGTPIVGRRLYATKADAPATGVTPTNAQWFLTVADVSSTLAAGENNKTLPEATISLADASGFATSGRCLITTADGIQVVTYTGKSTNDLTGCTGGTGTMATGGAVSQPMIPNNTATTYALDVADASFAATQPPIMDTAGKPVLRVYLTANQSAGDAFGPNVIGAQNDGGFSVEVTSGTVDWTLGGK
jgi:hypothetical protein